MGARTVKRLAILVTTILVAGSSIFFIQRYQVARMDRSVLAQAARAENDGNFEEAAHFYQEHLEVAPDDQEAKLKYADVLLKGPKNDARQAEAARLYDQRVTRFPDDKINRRRLAELYVEMGQHNVARPHLELLLNSEPEEGPEDGALHFLLGRCQEKDDPSRAAEAFRLAYEHDAPQRVEAYSRRADLLRRLNKPKEADEVIDEMVKKVVKSDAENYQVYLERGSYLRRFGRTPDERERAQDDLQRALKLGPNDPKVYAELAALARSSKNVEEARRFIEDGLKVLPNDPTLHLERANLEMSGSSGSIDKAITSLRRSLELLRDQPMLSWSLANLLAQRGDTDELLRQIGELKRLNLKPILIGLLEANYQINCGQWKKAILSLTRLQQLGEQSEEFKPQVQYLLARCYHLLGDREREREAYKSSIRANPKDVQARWGLAESLADRGEIDNAIREYRQLVDQLQQEQRDAELPAIRRRLAQLLIARNQQLAVGQRDWTEVEKLVKEFTPQSNEWVMLQTELLVAQEKIAEAQDLLEKARSRTSPDVDLWIRSAELLRRQRKFDDARKLLDQAQKALGDSVALRLERSRLLTVQGGADLPKALAALAENTASFSPTDRRRLIEVLAQEAAGLSDRTLVTGLWAQVAKLDPNNLDPQLQLLDLAFQAKNKAEIENRINEIKRIDGAEGSNGKYEEARYTIWRVENTADRAEQAKLRETARVQLNDLAARRPDWAKIPRILADLALADLAQPDLSKDQKESKQKDAVDLYVQAIKLGQRDLDTIRRATALLYAMGRKDKAIELWTQLSTPTPAGSAQLRQGSIEALLRYRDNEGALELARKAKEANPNDVRGSYFLTQILTANGRQDEAKTELRKAVDAAPLDPDRWIVLVKFLATSKALDEAEKVVRDAETALKEKPLGPAECCERLGQAYKTSGQDDEKSKFWLARAGRWYTAAGNLKASSLAVNRPYFSFLYRSGQIKDVQSQLRAILANKKQVEDPKNAEEIAWTRRTLASILLVTRDAEQRHEALTLVEPMDQATLEQQKRNGQPRKPEDLRFLAAVYEAQGIPAYHKKARDVLEEMDRANVADPDDRLNLASMYSRDGDWGNAHEQYRKLLAQTENTSDLEVSKRRPDYLAQFIGELLKHSQGDQRQELLPEAGELIEKLKALSPNTFYVVAFEARLRKAQNQMDKAVELLQAIAKLPDLSDPLWGQWQQDLANLADELGLTKPVEVSLRQAVEKSKLPQDRLVLASFLGYHGRLKEGLDECEQLWNGTTKPETLVKNTLEVLPSSSSNRDQDQLDRVAGWMQRELERNAKSSYLLLALAGLRDRQKRFQEAESLYAQYLKQGQGNAIEGNAIAMNNLAWLKALRGVDLPEALELINKAIARRGRIPVPELLDTRGVIYTKLGDTRKAIDDLNQAIAFQPTAAKYLHLAQAYLRARNKPAAAEALGKARPKGTTPEGLHALEVTAYQKLLNDLGIP